MGTERLLLRIPEAAAALGLGRSKLYELISNGTLRTVSIGRRRLISMEELRDYVARLQGEPEDHHPDGHAA